jgi:hypothetical protein
LLIFFNMTASFPKTLPIDSVLGRLASALRQRAFPLRLCQRNVRGDERPIFAAGEGPCRAAPDSPIRFAIEGEVLESYVTKTPDKAAALAFLKKALKRHRRAETIVTDGLRSYPAAMRQLGNLDRREIGRWLNNRAENSHLPFRRRERAMLRFRQMKALQKFASVHASLHNHFGSERHLLDRQTYKQRRSAALAEWRAIAA